MKITYEEEKRALYIFYEGEIDHHTCEEIAKISDESIQKYRPFCIIFDFKQVSFMDSSGIGMLLGRYKKIIRFGSQAMVQNVNYDLERIFKMSGIYKIIPKREEEISYGK